MKPLPDLTNQAAMAAIGQMSAIHFASKEVREAVRDVAVSLQSMTPEALGDLAPKLRSLADRLEAVSELALSLERSKQQRLPLHGEAA